MFHKKIARLASRSFRKRNVHEIDPDEVLIDSENLPGFNTYQFQGRFEKPMAPRNILSVAIVFMLVAAVFSFRVWDLQIQNGRVYAQMSERNRLRHTIIFADRGVVTDRKGTFLAWNEPVKGEDFSRRAYIAREGFAHLLGYVTSPLKDKQGIYYQENFIPHDGVEEAYSETLAGQNGLKIIETDVSGNVVSESLLDPPKAGQELALAIDAGLQEALHRNIKALADKVGFVGGAGAILDLQSGEIIAMTSYPEYSPQILADGTDDRIISSYVQNPKTPFVNRALNLYTPGSIMKPYLALGALVEGVISPEKKILSTGSIAIPNPYRKGEETVFMDWKAHGEVDMRDALAVSSNVYFYEVGGGYQDQKGLGISNIEKYLRLFGFGAGTGIDVGQEKDGVVPNPEWKRETFGGEEWRLGDTYNTAIGQYGVQITPIQGLRAVSAIATNGLLFSPMVVKRTKEETEREMKRVEENRIPISPSYFKIVREGMKEAVRRGTARALNNPYVTIGAKTGTAELGVSKKRVNSWVMGFFPYEAPRYSFLVLMESGPRANLFGSPLVMRDTIEYLAKNNPSYFDSDDTDDPPDSTR